MAKDKHPKIKDEKPKEIKEKETISAIVGLILVVFSLLIIANTGFVANTLKYVFVFLFGTCYLFVLLFLLFVGFYMIIKKKPFKIFGKMQYILLFLMFICVLALASYGHDVKFNTFTGEYKKLMPKSLNTGAASGSWGGGWLGFLLIAIFNTLFDSENWSLVIYIILLVGLTYLLFYKQINKLFKKIHETRKAKKEKNGNFQQAAVVDRKSTITGQTLDHAQDNESNAFIIPNPTVENSSQSFKDHETLKNHPGTIELTRNEKKETNSVVHHRSLSDFDDIVDDLEATKVISSQDMESATSVSQENEPNVIVEVSKNNQDLSHQNLFVTDEEVQPSEEDLKRMREYEQLKQEQLQNNNPNKDMNSQIQNEENQETDADEKNVQSQVFFEKDYVKPTPTTFSYVNHSADVEPSNESDENEVQENSHTDMPYNFKTYQFPSLSLLKDPKNVQEILQENAVSANEKADILMKKMKELNIDAEIIGYSIGPTVTQYEARLNKGKVNAVQNAIEDLKLALGVVSLRIVSPIKRNSIGIEVPNDKKSMVTFKEIMSYIIYMKDLDPKIAKMDTIMPIGKDIAGNPVIASITKMPHCLISGATNSGKSVCANTIICSLLYQYKPNELRFIMIDPKRVEMLFYKDLPHLLCPIIIDAEHAAVALVKLCNEMQKRFDIFSKYQVKNIASYNEMRRKNNEEIMPFIVLVVDEFAELMLSKQSAIIEEKVQSLVQLGRASGIHLILCTQRPSVNVITGTIKNNIPCRLTFRLSSFADSKTVIDYGGAEKLLNNGDMLLLTPESSDLLRVQGTYISDDEIESIVAFCANQCPVQYDPEFLDLQTAEEKEKALHTNLENGDNKNEDEDEALYQDIRYYVLKEQTIVTSLIQGKFKIGYGKVSMFINRLAEEGIIGQKAGGKGREVLMTLEEWESLNNEKE